MAEDYKLSAVTAPEYSFSKLPPMLTAQDIAEWRALMPQLPAQDIQDYYDAWAKNKELGTMMNRGTGDYSGTNISPWLYIKESGGVGKKEFNKLPKGRR